MPDTPAIEVSHLEKQYATGKRAVDDVSFTIARGETFALLGPNGAGKTTTVEVLEGYRSRTGGDVRVLGHDPARASRSHNARVGIVLQTSAESPNVTVAEQLRHFATLYPRHRSVDELLAATGLESQRNTRISRLSGGQRRRVDVALGIIGRPEVLFLDEPTTGFDPRGPAHVLGPAPRCAGRGHDDPPHHALPRRGRTPGRPRRGDRRREAPRHRPDRRDRRRRGTDPSRPVARRRWHPARNPYARRRPPHPDHPNAMHELEVIRPSLEDVYLGMVGTR